MDIGVDLDQHDYDYYRLGLDPLADMIGNALAWFERLVDVVADDDVQIQLTPL